MPTDVMLLCGKQWSVIAAVVVCLLSSAVKGELLRCYCNQASCVTTGYMCKTKTRCFSDVQRGLHGCLGALPRCEGLHCCDEDMCNYVHYEYARAPQNPPSPPQDDCVECADRLELIVSAMQKEVWFKAAVIAVPIAGACILALLALAAARLLRSDRQTLMRRGGPHPIYYPPKGTLLAFPRTLRGDFRDTLLPWSNKDKSTTIV